MALDTSTTVRTTAPTAESRGTGTAHHTVVIAPKPPVIELEERRKAIRVSQNDVLAILGAACAAIAMAALLFNHLGPFSGVLGFFLLSYFLFLAFYAALVWIEQRGPAVKDKIAAVFVHSLAVVLVTALAFVITYTLIRGFQALSHRNFFKQDLSTTGPLQPLSTGGIAHAIVGTIEQITIALLITVPVGITAAVFLNEFPGRFARFVRTITEAMTALPSIVAGLFIYATFILILGFPKSGFAAALAISVMILPIMIRAADVVIRLVPGSLKEASYAMGAGQWRTVWHVVLPTALPGLTTAIILGTARGIGETSPVLLTAGFTAAMNANPFSGPQVSLPLEVFQLVKSPAPTMIARGFGAAAVLMLLVLILFVIARYLGGRRKATQSKRQMAKNKRASARDLERIEGRNMEGFNALVDGASHGGSRA